MKTLFFIMLIIFTANALFLQIKFKAESLSSEWYYLKGNWKYIFPIITMSYATSNTYTLPGAVTYSIGSVSSLSTNLVDNSSEFVVLDNVISADGIMILNIVNSTQYKYGVISAIKVEKLSN